MARYNAGFEHWLNATGRINDNDIGGVDYYEWLKANAPEPHNRADGRWGDPDISDLVWARQQFLDYGLANPDLLWGQNAPGGDRGLYEWVEEDHIVSNHRARRNIEEASRFNEADYLAALAQGKSSWEVRNWLGDHLHVDNARVMFDALTENRRNNITKLYEEVLGRDPDEEGLQHHLNSGQSLAGIADSMQRAVDRGVEPGPVSEETTEPEVVPEVPEVPEEPEVPEVVPEEPEVVPEEPVDEQPDDTPTVEEPFDKDASSVVVNDISRPFLDWWRRNSGPSGPDYISPSGSGLNDIGRADYRFWLEHVANEMDNFTVRQGRESIAQFINDNPTSLYGPNRSDWPQEEKVILAEGKNLQELINGDRDSHSITSWVGMPPGVQQVSNVEGSTTDPNSFGYWDFLHARSQGYTDSEILNWLELPEHIGLKNTPEGLAIHSHLRDVEGWSDPVVDPVVNPGVLPGEGEADPNHRKRHSYYYKLAHAMVNSNSHWDLTELSDDEVSSIDNEIQRMGLNTSWDATDAAAGRNNLGMNSEERLQAFLFQKGIPFVQTELGIATSNQFTAADYIWMLKYPPNDPVTGTRMSKPQVRQNVMNWLHSEEGKRNTPNWTEMLRKIGSTDQNEIGTYFGDYSLDDRAGQRFTEDDVLAHQAAGFNGYDIRDWLDSKPDSWRNDSSMLAADVYDNLIQQQEYPGFEASDAEKSASQLYRFLAWVVGNTGIDNWQHSPGWEDGDKPQVFLWAFDKLTAADGRISSSDIPPGHPGHGEYGSHNAKSHRGHVIKSLDDWARKLGITGGIRTWNDVKRMLTTTKVSTTTWDDDEERYITTVEKVYVGGTGVPGDRAEWEGIAWTKEEAEERGMRHCSTCELRYIFEKDENDNYVAGPLSHVPAGREDFIPAFDMRWEFITSEERAIGGRFTNYWARANEAGVELAKPTEPGRMYEGDPMAGGRVLTDLPWDDDIGDVNLSHIQMLALTASAGVEFGDDYGRGGAAVEAVEDWFLDYMFNNRDSEGNLIQAGVDIADDDWGLDLFRVYQDEDRPSEWHRMSINDIVEWDEDLDEYRVLHDNAINFISGGNIDWAFYNESPEYLAAKNAAGIEGAYDSIQEIRDANQYVLALMQNPDSGIPYDPYARQFIFSPGIDGGPATARKRVGSGMVTLPDPVTSVTDAQLEGVAGSGVAADLSREAQGRYSDITVEDQRGAPGEIGHPQDWRKGGDITKDMFTSGTGRYGADWGDTSAWRQETRDIKHDGRKILDLVRGRVTGSDI